MNRLWKQPHVSISARCIQRVATTHFSDIKTIVLPRWRSVMQQAKQSWLSEWLGQKRRPSWGMLTHKPLHQRETAQQENTCNLMSVASAVKIVKLNNALEDERSWFYSNSLVCTLCHQNWLQKNQGKSNIWITRSILPPFYKIGILIKCASLWWISQRKELKMSAEYFILGLTTTPS